MTEEPESEWFVIRGALERFVGLLFVVGCRYNDGFSSSVEITSRSVTVRAKYQGVVTVDLRFMNFSDGSYEIRTGQGTMIRAGRFPKESFKSVDTLTTNLEAVLNQLVHRADAVNPVDEPVELPETGDSGGGLQLPTPSREAERSSPHGIPSIEPVQ